MMSCAWLWLYAGAFLMLAELLTPGFVVFFFGLAAMTVGLCRFALGDIFTPTWQCAAFSVFCVLYLVFLRRWLKYLFAGTLEKARVDFNHETVGRLGRVTVAIQPPTTGRVMIGDAEWTAKASVPIDVGANVRVTAQENLTMTVVKVS